ncbi:MAG: hypothetical protein IPK44_24515 [Candidatus Accumulibacter sp.]|uniref:hypothetical protein n=1 Tax=Accumulibacter sp. TaxID=2053492 RepID=UPI00258A7047|nr:hypothetical protein [Accumulibacter sp.]MBK8117454.1 hypothetical protein [Accumulibacter sp.]
MNTKITVSSASSSNWIPVNYKQQDFKISLGLEISGTGVYKVEHTFDNPFTVASPVAFPHSVLTGIVASTDSNYSFPVTAIRLTCTSYTSGSGILTIVQGN